MREPDRRWIGTGTTQEYLDERAEWISRDPGFKGATIMYFRAAGSLLRFSWYDYTLIPVAFFQAVVGLEDLLRRAATAKNAAPFGNLFKEAVVAGQISDGDFRSAAKLPREFLKLMDANPSSYAERLSLLIPKLRNQYLHGDYLLSPTFLDLTINVREIANALFARSPALGKSRR